MSEHRKLTYEDLVYLITKLQKYHIRENEPIPDITPDCRESLKQVLESPFAGIESQEFYPTFEEKAAVLFYNFCKLHPLGNGNKRCAIAALDLFCAVNLRRARLKDEALKKLALDTVNSDSAQYKEVIDSLRIQFKSKIKPFGLWLMLVSFVAALFLVPYFLVKMLILKIRLAYSEMRLRRIRKRLSAKKQKYESLQKQ